MSGKKRTSFAYFFALIGGLSGLHHLYLGRTQHACLWFTTFGGFGFGLVYELIFSIRKYVAEANDDQLTLMEYWIKMRQRKSPAFETLRFCCQFITAVFYGLITYYAFPERWLQSRISSLFVALCSTVAIAIGTQMAGTIGPRRCAFVWPLLGAILGMPFLLWYSDGSPSFNIAAFISSWIFEWKIEWDQDCFPPLPGTLASTSPTSQPKGKQRRHFLKRCLILGLTAALFSGLFTSAIYQNLQVDINGERVKIKDVIKDFFNTPEWIQITQQLKNVLSQLWAFYLQQGFRGIWTQLWREFDFESDKKAYEILELKSNVGQKEIEAQCRKLSRQWHPDRYRDPIAKQKAEATFMNIQQACNRLSYERKKRQTINTQKRENPN